MLGFYIRSITLYKTSKQEEFSIAYIRAIAAPLGFNPGKYDIDNDSIDITFSAKYSNDSLIRSPELHLQLKCTEKEFSKDNFLHYQLSLKNYTELRGANISQPRYLVIVCIPKNENDWVNVRESDLILRYSAYWFSLRYAPDTNNSSSVTIKIPKNQKLNKESFKMLMDNASKGIGL
jgi:hypothetical protein